MSQIIQSLLPIILLVLAGVVLLRSGFFDEAFRRGLDRLVYWVALPALIVQGAASGSALFGQASWMIAVFGGATVISMAAAYPVAWAMRMPAKTVGVFVQAGFRGNLAFVGIPVLLLATGGDEAIIPLAVLVFAPSVLLYNILAVIVLTLAHHRLQRGALLMLLRSIATNPFVVSSVVGIGMAVLGVRLPEPVDTAMRMVGQTAAPLALISLGGAVVTYRVHRHVGVGLAAAAIKLLVLPALVLLLAWLAGLDQQQRMIVLVLAATPTAVASYVLAVQLRGDAGVAAATIVISTVLSVLSLGAALALA